MTPVEAKAVLETLLGRAVPNEQLLRVVEKMTWFDRHGIWRPADPANPTLDEYADFLGKAIIRFLLDEARIGAARKTEREFQSQIGGLHDEASTDLDWVEPSGNLP